MMIDLIETQLLDPLRIGLILGLVITMFRTQAVTGRVLPLALGVVFVAVILPLGNPKPQIDLVTAVLAGIVANLALLAVTLALAIGYLRLRR
jgi:hypothetical protein